ncbi:MAG: NADH-quinone oxidoreductase subunit NuoK [Acidobacteriota bacterium]
MTPIQDTLPPYLVISAILFSLGVLGIVTRRNAVNVLMGIELVLNAANLNFAAFSRFAEGGVKGQVFALFVIVVAAAEVAVALAIVLSMYKIVASVDLDQASVLKE